jgi:hypothetical protein
LEARSVLGLSPVRAAFLDHLYVSNPRKGQVGRRVKPDPIWVPL